MQQRQVAIAVMAKAPRAGHSKTRLSPPLLPDESRAMSAAFLRDVTENLRLAATRAPIAPFVAFAPAGLEHLFDGLLADGTRLLLADGNIPPAPGVEGFGLCLLHAVQGLLEQGFAAAALLNADSPDMPTAYLTELAERLLDDGDRAVLGPAEDGGYYALGLKQSHPHLFADIPWSTATVADATRTRAREAGVALVELPAWYDVDDAAALRRFLAGGGPDASAAPASYAEAARLGLTDRLLAA